MVSEFYVEFEIGSTIRTVIVVFAELDGGIHVALER